VKIDRTVMRSLALFDRMSDEDLDRLLAHANARRVAQGDAVFEQGQQAANFFLLLHGRLKVTQVTKDGQQIIVRVVHPGDLFGFARALQRSDYPGTARAATESVILGWPTDLWPRFVEQNPHLAVSAMQTIGQRLEEALPASARCPPRRWSAASPMPYCGFPSRPGARRARAR
jgi:CRP/FNR family transcriptional regulator, nitrogen oxide reductase regulator